MRDLPPPPAPIALLAELTYRCPLACPYCSNPLELSARDAELDTATWARVFGEAAELGVLQLHLSGGEPASRRDLVELVAAARQADLYVNLITSGIGLTETRLDALEAAGLDHVQLSLQGVRAGIADRIGGYRGGFDRKLAVARAITDRGFPLTLNAVMHRQNLDDLAETISFAADLGARRIEVACVQFYGWAQRNRAALLPTRAQVEAAKRTVAEAVRTYRGRMAIDFVPPDYYADYPKACMGGWGSTGLNVAPEGTVLPCHAAATIPELSFQRVTEVPLAEIWAKGPAFQKFRGHDWMPDPCLSCARRDIDHGGCRCQAMALAGDPHATDPVCRHAPHRALVDSLLANLPADDVLPKFVYRR
ncbi:pyrroloquinoline quinone biosynthesis protein PqqE [Pararhodobacter sp. SW119]|uniref:pyrroloquinoline quinone biosynthesis protein PqqE n=1 Tax=Pararhodobacter sp. SW119 TaxID=2780075 RepID=UPI001ADFBC85|nr:pyrroloquinoline quinone biosynthesis protein PqqE [Pararhodobacter sp. SW119]